MSEGMAPHVLRDLDPPVLFAHWPGHILMPPDRLDYVIAQSKTTFAAVRLAGRLTQRG
jgi:hypothetical protein